MMEENMLLVMHEGGKKAEAEAQGGKQMGSAVFWSDRKSLSFGKLKFL